LKTGKEKYIFEIQTVGIKMLLDCCKNDVNIIKYLCERLQFSVDQKEFKQDELGGN